MASKKKFDIGSPYTIGVIVLILLFGAWYIYGQTPFGPKNGSFIREATETTIGEETRTPTGEFEFRGPGYVEVSDPRDASIIIVNAPGARDARPIDVTLRVGGNIVWEKKISADEPNCGDNDNCSISIDPDVRQAWTIWFTSKEKVELSATDASNNLLALFSLLGAKR